MNGSRAASLCRLCLNAVVSKRGAKLGTRQNWGQTGHSPISIRSKLGSVLSRFSSLANPDSE